MYITVCASVADSKKVASKGRNGHQRFHQDSNNRGKSGALGIWKVEVQPWYDRRLNDCWIPPQNEVGKLRLPDSRQLLFVFLHDKCFETLYISSKTSWLREGRRAFKAARGTLLAYKSLLAARACHVCKQHQKSKQRDRRDVGPHRVRFILFRFGLFYMFCFVLFLLDWKSSISRAWVGGCFIFISTIWNYTPQSSMLSNKPAALTSIWFQQTCSSTQSGQVAFSYVDRDWQSSKPVDCNTWTSL